MRWISRMGLKSGPSVDQSISRGGDDSSPPTQTD
jgi:hypothetical protein